MISNLRPISDHVLIKITQDTEKIKLGDMELYMDTSFQKYHNSPTEGVVMKVPDRLSDIKVIQGKEFVTRKRHVEIKNGDIVIFNYKCYASAVEEKKPNLIIEDGVKYLLVKYEEIYLAKRRSELNYSLAKNMTEKEMGLNQFLLGEETDGSFTNQVVYKVITLNDVSIIEPIEDKLESKYLTIIQKKEEAKRGIVRFSQKFTPGTIIGLHKTFGIPLQYDLQRTVRNSVGELVELCRVNNDGITCLLGSIYQES